MESVGLKPEGIGSIPIGCTTKDSSVVEQMTLNHRDAGSNPVPTLRFSLKN